MSKVKPGFSKHLKSGQPGNNKLLKFCPKEIFLQKYHAPKILNTLTDKIIHVPKNSL